MIMNPSSPFKGLFGFSIFCFFLIDFSSFVSADICIKQREICDLGWTESDGRRCVCYGGSFYYLSETLDDAFIDMVSDFGSSPRLAKPISSVSRVGKSYIFAGSQRLAEVRDNTISFYHPDHLGSTVKVTDEDGNIVSSADYMPFGSELRFSGSVANRFRYTGKELDSETDWYYYGARYYDPELGRFVSVDPIADGVNRYAYVENNPLKLVDPSGNMVLAASSLKKPWHEGTEFSETYPSLSGILRFFLGGSQAEELEGFLTGFNPVTGMAAQTVTKVTTKVTESATRRFLRNVVRSVSLEETGVEGVRLTAPGGAKNVIKEAALGLQQYTGTTIKKIAKEVPVSMGNVPRPRPSVVPKYNPVQNFKQELKRLKRMLKTGKEHALEQGTQKRSDVFRQYHTKLEQLGRETDIEGLQRLQQQWQEEIR